MAIKPGDIVQLKSGGPKMTAAINDSITGWRCSWFNDRNELKYGDFPEETLTTELTGPAPDINEIIRRADEQQLPPKK